MTNQLDANLRKKYYRKRDGSLYTTYTKDEIDSLIDLEKFSTWYPFLKDMDYPAIPRIYQEYKNFHKYIARMRLVSFKNYGWNDGLLSEYKPVLAGADAFISTRKAYSEKFVLTRRKDGDWDCVSEQMGYTRDGYYPIRITGVIDKGNIPAMLEFKLNEGCLYKMEVIEQNDTNK